MKAIINKDGVLILYPTTGAEYFACQQWQLMADLEPYNIEILDEDIDDEL